MKKILLPLVALLMSASVYAQQQQTVTMLSAEKQSNFIRNNNTPLQAQHPNHAKKTRGGSRWYDIIDAIDKDQGGAGAIYANDNYNILWTDSTMLAPYGSGANLTYDGIWIKSIAAFFDPADPRFNDPTDYAGEIEISRNSAYTLDSLFLPFIYRRNPAKPSIVDTLIVSIIKGNGSGTSSDLAIRYYGPASTTAINHGVDTLRFLHGFLNLNTASANPYTFGASVPGNVMNIKIPLTAATAIDTLANGFNYFQIPVNMSIPPANIPAVSVTFKSGDTWVPYLDTLYISGNTNYKFNHFRFVAFEENAGLYQTYLKNYWNQSSLMKNDTSGWHNWHIPSYAFTNTTYEHQWFNWKATCASCGIVGINTLEDKSASLKIFPNPAQKSVNFEIHSTNELVDPKIELLSFDGKVLVEESIKTIAANQTYSKSIDLSMLARGIYLIKMQTAKGMVSQKLVVE